MIYISFKKYPPKNRIKTLLNIIIILNINASFCFFKFINKLEIGDLINKNKIDIANI